MRTHPETDLSAYAAGSLAADERARVDAHLADCGECRAAVADFRLLLDRLAATTPEPPAIAWPRYRSELRARRAARGGAWTRARWLLRPIPLTASAMAAAACAIVLYVAVGARPPADLAAMESDGLAGRMEMIDHYQVVEELDLLEDFELIRNLDRLAPTREG